MDHETCKTCQKNNFTIENCERICTYCGEVQDELVDEGRLCMIPDQETLEDNFRNKNQEANDRLNGRIRGETNDAQTRKLISREKIFDESRRMVKQMIKHPDAVTEAMDLVKRTLNSYQGRLTHSKRQSLVAACVYYLSSRHQLGITLAELCKQWGLKMKHMNISLKQVKQLSPDYEYERPNIRDLVAKFIDRIESRQFEIFNPDDSDVSITQTLLESKDKQVLTNRVMLLIDLFEAMHPFNQPSPQCLISAVVYHAWRSLDTFRMIAVNLSSNMRRLSSALSGQSKEVPYEPEAMSHAIGINGNQFKHQISYEKFCKICDIKCSNNSYNIVRKVQSSLLILGKCFGDINKLNLPWYLKDIIDNSTHLIQQHLKSNPTSSE